MELEKISREASAKSGVKINTTVAKGNVYKVVGQIMVQSKREDLKKDLESRKEVSELRGKNFDKQEKSLKDRLTRLRDEVMSELK